MGHSRYYKNRYYEEIHKESTNVFYNENTPGVIHNKTMEQMTYENNVLIQELSQRD